MRTLSLKYFGVALLAASTLFSACGGGGGGGGETTGSPSQTTITSVALAIGPSSIEQGQSAQATATAFNSAGVADFSRTVTFSTTDSRVATIGVTGRIFGVAPGTVTVSATIEGKVASTSVVVTPTLSDRRLDVVNAMLAEVSSVVPDAISYNDGLLSRNPQSAGEIQATNTMLSRASAISDIVNQRFVVSTAVTSTDGRRIPIVAVYADPTTRAGAQAAIGSLQLAVRALEFFYKSPLPVSEVKVWYGFYLGGRDAGATIYIDSQEVYDARVASRGGVGIIPLYEPILVHELSHTYIGHESLNQFVEVFAYNYIVTGSTDIDRWTYTRAGLAAPPPASNVQPLLAVYRLLGSQAMSDAYVKLVSLRPPYGVALSEACKQAFVDQASASNKSQVRTLVDPIVY